MIDLTQMIINLGDALLPLQRLFSGASYVTGTLLIILGIIKLKAFAEMRGGSNHSMFSSFAFIGGGALLLYLPTYVTVMANTFFDSNNILSYTTSTTDPLMHAILLLIETTGLLWVVRGTTLLINSSKPGEQHGPKGLAFLVAGIFAMNFDNTYQTLGKALDWFIALMASFGS